MANNGKIELVIDIDAILGKINLDVAALQKTLQEAVSKVSKLEVKPGLQVTVDQIKKDAEAAKVKVAEAINAELSKINVNIGLTQKVHDQLTETGAIVSKDGAIVASKLQKFLRDILELEKGQRIDKKSLFVSRVLELEGKSVDEARGLIGNLKTLLDETRVSLENSGKGIEAPFQKANEKISAALSKTRSNLRADAKAMEKDILALADVMRLVSVNGDNVKLNIAGSGTREGIKLLTDELARGEKALFRLAAASENQEAIEEKMNVSLQEAAVRLSLIREEYVRQKAALDGIIAEESKATKSKNELLRAEEALATATKNRIAAQGNEGLTELQYVQELTNAYRAEFSAAKQLDQLKRQGLDNSNAVLKELEGQRELTSAVKARIVAEENLAQAERNYNSFQVTNNAERKVSLGLLQELIASQRALETVNKSDRSVSNQYKLDAEAIREKIREEKNLLDTKNKVTQLEANYDRAVKSTTTSEESKLKVLRLLLDTQTKLENLPGSKLDNSKSEFYKKELERLSALKAGVDAVTAAENKLAEATAAVQQRQNNPNTNALVQAQALTKVLTEQYNAQLALERLNNSDHSTSNTLAQNLENHKASIVVLKQEAEALNVLKEAETKAFQALEQLNTAIRNNDVLSQEDLATVKRSVTAYENLLQTSKAATAEIHSRTNAWQNESKTITENIRLMEIENKLRESTSRLKTAIGSGNANAEVAALRDIVKYHQQIIDILGVEGKALSSNQRVHLQSSINSREASAEVLKGLQQQTNEANRLGGAYTSLTSAFRSFLRYGVEMAAFYKAFTGVEAVAKSVVDLEDALKGVQAIARATDSEMTSVAASIKRVAIDTEYSTTEIAGAAQMLAQAGVEISKVGEALDAVAKFASATGSSMAETTDLLTSMHNVYKDLSFQQISDQLTNTINLSKLTAGGLSTIISRALEVSDAFHIMPQQMESAFAVLANAGVKASTISTGFREALLELFAPDEKALNYLQQRYHELGTEMSKETIAAMFQGFANSADPIRSVTQELEKLGYSTSAAAEFSRIFSVRANNVLKILVDQRDEYVKLSAQIGESGSAAKGAQTQLEALGKSWQNLGSIITVVATESFGGILSTLEKIVDKMGDVITKGGEMINTLKVATGSSGAGGSLFAGLLGGLATLKGGGSGLKAAITGINMATLTELAQSTAASLGSKVSEGVGGFLANVASTVGIAFSAVNLIGKFGKAAEVAATSSAQKIGVGMGSFLANKAVSDALTAKLGAEAAAVEMSRRAAIAEASGAAAVASSSIKGFFASILKSIKDWGLELIAGFNLVRAAALRNPVIAGVTAVVAGVAAAYTLFHKDIEGQLSGLSNVIERADKEIKDAVAAKDSQKAAQKDLELMKASLTNVNQSLVDYLKAQASNVTWTEEKVAKIVAELQGVSQDLGGSQLATVMAKLKDSVDAGLGDNVNIQGLIAKINESTAVIDQIEGKRLSLQQKLIEAYEASDRTGEQESLITAFQSLDAAQQAQITNQVTKSDEATAFLKTMDLYAAVIDEKVYSKLKDAEAKKAEAEVKSVELAIKQSLEDTGGYSGVYAKIVQATKDGNIELLRKYKDSIDKALTESGKGEFEKFAIDVKDVVSRFLSSLKTFIDDSLPKVYTPEEVKNKDAKDKAAKEAQQATAQQAKALIDANIQSVIENSVAHAAKNVKDLDKTTAELNDRFRSLLTPEQANSIGLANSATEQHSLAVEKAIAPLSREWQDVYLSASTAGKSVKDSIKYLDAHRDAAGKLPPELENYYEGLQRMSDLQDKSIIEVDRRRKEYENSAKLVKDNADEQASLNNQMLSLIAERNSITGNSLDDERRRYVLDGRITDLQGKFEKAKTIGVQREEEANKFRTFYNDKMNQLGFRTVEQEQKLKDINAAYDLRHKNYLANAERIKTLEAEKADLAGSGNAGLKKILAIDEEIYRLKAAEPESIIKYADEQLSASESLRKAMGSLTSTYTEKADFLKSAEGMKWLEANKDEAAHAQKLLSSIEQVTQARQAQADQIIASTKAMAQAELDKGNQAVTVEVTNAQRAQGLTAGSDPAKDAAAQTKIIEDEIAKRSELQKKYFNDVVAGAERAARFEISKTGDVTKADQIVNIAKKASLEDYLKFHQDSLTKLLGEEKSHADAVKSIQDEIRNVRQSDADFARSIARISMTDYDQMEFDRVNAAKDASAALQLIRQGDYNDGKAQLDKAIQEQQAYVTEIANAEKAGLVSAGSTSSAMSNLNALNEQRIKILQEQAAAQQKAQDAAKQAADLEIQAIQQLTTVLQTLTEAIGGLPKVDIGDQTSNIAGLKDMKSALDSVSKSATDANNSLNNIGGGPAPVQADEAGKPGTLANAVEPKNWASTTAEGFRTDAKGALNYKSSVDEVVQSHNDLTSASASTNTSLASTQTSYQELDKQVVKLTDSTGQVTYSTANLADGLNTVNSATAPLADGVGIVNDHVYKMVDAFGNVSYVQGQFISATQAANSTLYDTGEKANVARKNVDGTATSVTNLANSANQVNPHLQGLNTGVSKLGQSSGEAAKQIGEAKGKVDELSKSDPIKVKADATEAVKEVESVGEAESNLEDKEITISANVTPAMDGIDQVQQALAAVKDKTVTITTNYVSKGSPPQQGGSQPTQRAATGGYIQGPGTGTSDSIPAMLSNGEFVVPAAAVQKIGLPKLEMVRKGIVPTEPRKYATGGLVTDPWFSDGGAWNQGGATQKPMIKPGELESSMEQAQADADAMAFQNYALNLPAWGLVAGSGHAIKYAHALGAMLNNHPNEVVTQALKEALAPLSGYNDLNPSREPVAKVEALIPIIVEKIKNGPKERKKAQEEAQKEAQKKAEQAAKDAQKAVEDAQKKAEQDAKKQKQLNIELMKAKGDTAGVTKAQREDTLADMTPAQKTTQKSIWAIEDLAAQKKKAEEDAAAAAKKAADVDAAKKAAEPKPWPKVDTPAVTTPKVDTPAVTAPPVDTKPQAQLLSSSPAIKLSQLPQLSQINQSVGQIPSLLNQNFYSNMQGNKPEPQKTVTIELKNVSTGETATVSSDQLNVGKVLDVLKSLKGVTI